MNVEDPGLSTALKTLWGAAEMPFGAGCPQPYRHPAFEELIRRLSQLCEIGASGMVFGRNGVGKSYLCGCFLESLPEKRYKILCLAHSSLTGSDLLPALCRQLGLEPQMRRSDNVAVIHTAFAQWGTRWPILVIEEAQNLSAGAIEEVRLLTCARTLVASAQLTSILHPLCCHDADDHSQERPGETPCLPESASEGA